MIVTGVLLFVSEALKCYYSPPFWLKMLFLTLAILSHLRCAAGSRKPLVTPWQMKTVALVSVLLWSGVGLMGRGIGFY